MTQTTTTTDAEVCSASASSTPTPSLEPQVCASLVTRPPEAAAALGLPRPIGEVGELMRFHDDVTKIVVGALSDGVDYGTIPGTKTPTLLKPGAEKLCMAFGVVPEYDIIEKEVDHDREVHWQKRYASGVSYGLYRYVVRCRLVCSGRVLAHGMGSCSTMEAKYIDRPRDVENTVLKMAKKRAQIDAVLTGFNLSNRFTQDMEDVTANKEAAGDPSLVYNNQLVDHKNRLAKEFVRLGVPRDMQKTLSDKLNGRPFSDLSQVIREIGEL